MGRLLVQSPTVRGIILRTCKRGRDRLQGHINCHGSHGSRPKKVPEVSQDWQLLIHSGILRPPQGDGGRCCRYGLAPDCCVTVGLPLTSLDLSPHLFSEGKEFLDLQGSFLLRRLCLALPGISAGDPSC